MRLFLWLQLGTLMRRMKSMIQSVHSPVIYASRLRISICPFMINCHCLTAQTRANGTTARAVMARHMIPSPTANFIIHPPLQVL